MNREELIADYLGQLRQKYRDEHDKLGAMQGDKSVSDVSRNWQGGRVNGLGDARMMLESALRAQADSASTPAWDVHGVISFVDELIGEDCNDECRALVRKTIARLATPSPERTSDGVRSLLERARQYVADAGSNTSQALRLVEEIDAALSSTPTDALPGTEK